MKRRFLLLVFFAGLSVVSFGQKVKYKELFVLLNAKNYSDAEPYLRFFLLEEPDHPNANFHMGSLLQGSLKELNILTESELYTETADSSVFYYEKSLSYITEKDVKKVSLIILIVVLAVLVFLVIKPVLLSIIAGLILAYIFYPVYKWIVRRVKYKTLAAAIVSIIVLLIIISQTFLAMKMSRLYKRLLDIENKRDSG